VLKECITNLLLEYQAAKRQQWLAARPPRTTAVGPWASRLKPMKREGPCFLRVGCISRPGCMQSAHGFRITCYPLASGRSAPHYAAHGACPFVPSRLAAPGRSSYPGVVSHRSTSVFAAPGSKAIRHVLCRSIDRSQGWGTGPQEARNSDPKSSGKLSSVGTCQASKR
jgi:hypothetical protein